MKAPESFRIAAPALVGPEIGKLIGTDSRLVEAANRYADLRVQVSALLAADPVDRAALDAAIGDLVVAYGDSVGSALNVIVAALAVEATRRPPAPLELNMAGPLQLAPLEVRLSLDGPVAIERQALKIERDARGNVTGVGPA